MFDLQGRDRAARVGLEVVEGLCLGVGDPDRFGDAAVDGFFEGFPGFAERDVFKCDGGVFGVLPPCLLRVSFLQHVEHLGRFGAAIPDSEFAQARCI
jgi:hypothetical protein